MEGYTGCPMFTQFYKMHAFRCTQSMGAGEGGCSVCCYRAGMVSPATM